MYEILQVPRITKHEVHIEFIIVDESNGGLSENDAMTLNQGNFFVIFFFKHFFCYFTRLNLKRISPLKFCLPALLGIDRNPRQKVFLKSSEGFLR